MARTDKVARAIRRSRAIDAIDRGAAHACGVAHNRGMMGPHARAIVAIASEEIAPFAALHDPIDALYLDIGGEA